MTLTTDSPLVTGPTKSERLGTVLAIDVGVQEPALAVSRDNRMPRASLVVTTAARTLIRISKAGEKFETLAVVGSECDPTLHPDFREIATNLRDLRNKWFSKAKLCLATDEPHLERPEVRLALGVFDKVLVRFEWGTAKVFSAATGRKSTELADLQTSLGNLENLVVIAQFYRGDVDNSTDAEIKAWLKRLSELSPREIHLLNPDPKGPSKAPKKWRPVPKSRLQEITAELSKKAGVPVHTYTSGVLLG